MTSDDARDARTPAADARPQPDARERALVLLIAAVQFVNILDFVIVMPMGPDFARSLHFDEAKAAYLAGAYTGAAAVSGFLGSFFLDRFDRRPALLTALTGLVIGTALATLAWDLPSLMAARVIAGAFGGPATSLAFSIIADVVPAARRGAAMGKVMGAFGAASVLGVPLGLELANRISWRAPFVAVALAGAATIVFATSRLPSLTGHLGGVRTGARQSMQQLLGDRLVLSSYALTATVMMAGFIIIPSISAYIQENLHYPRARIGLLYLVGGMVSMIIVPRVGKLVDRFGATRVGSFGSLLLIAVVFTNFYQEHPAWPVMPMFVCFMIAMGFRNVAYNTLATKVPPPALRARFQSLQSTVQHGASAFAGFIGGSMLHKHGDRIEGMPRLALVTIGLSLAVPLLLALVEAGVTRRAPITTIPPGRVVDVDAA